eukprot:scaffold15146_cov72-Phaeocystis_antarctica.AAC.5
MKDSPLSTPTGKSCCCLATAGPKPSSSRSGPTRCRRASRRTQATLTRTLTLTLTLTTEHGP